MLKKIIPNLFTSLNLLSGVIGIIFVFSNKLDWASYCIGIAAILDFFDGFAARLLKVDGAFGKQLDSLADLVTFGVLPGFMVYKLMAFSLMQDTPLWFINEKKYILFAFSALLIPVFSAIRLAKFNIDTRQTTSFLGLPTPANAIFWVGVALSFVHAVPQSILYHLFQSSFFLVIGGIVSSALLVSEIPMLALKFKDFSWKLNVFKYIFLMGALMLFVFFFTRQNWYPSIFLVIVWYIIISIASSFISRKD